MRINEFGCGECGNVFESKTELISHLKVSNNKSYRNANICKYPNCNTSFNCVSLLKSHISEAHMPLKPHKCLLCVDANHCFEDKYKLRRHVLKYHSKYKCNECKFTYISNELLSRHKQVFHSGNQLKCRINDCGFRTDSKERYFLHLREHEMEDKKEREAEERLRLKKEANLNRVSETKFKIKEFCENNFNENLKKEAKSLFMTAFKSRLECESKLMTERAINAKLESDLNDRLSIEKDLKNKIEDNLRIEREAKLIVGEELNQLEDNSRSHYLRSQELAKSQTIVIKIL